jgi:uncharacterized protein with FMN-binding domain
MSKSILSWTGVALALTGVSIVSGHPTWIPFAVGVVLIAAAIAFAVAARAVSKADEPSGKRVSNDLVALSAAAVIAVYAAGFHRTKAANDEFEAQRSRHRAPRPVPAEMMPPSSAQSAPAPAPLYAIDAPVAAATPTQLPPAAVSAPQPMFAKNSVPASSAAAAAPSQNIAPSVTGSPAASIAETAQSESLAPVAAPAQTAPAAAPSPVPASIPGQVPAPSNVASTSAAPAPTPSEIPLMPKLKYKDGSFLGWGRSAHGNIQASVVIENGRISQTVIARCETAYSCDWIARLPGQVLSRQDPAVDVVSGASDSSYAFQDAVSAALFKAQRGE